MGILWALALSDVFRLDNKMEILAFHRELGWG